jgi:16S rRNA (uracil1498-N3)-methyltransferase
VSIPRFFAPEASHDAPLVRLTGDEAHHLARVLRLTVDSRVLVFDGAGRQWTGRVVTIGRRDAVVRLGEPEAAAAEPSVPLTLGIGVLKGDQMDTVVRDATMLGVRRIAPLQTDHVTVPERAWRAGAAAERWRRVAVASAKQCGRAVVPAIDPVQTFSSALESLDSACRVLCVEPAHAAPARDVRALPRPASAAVFVGPEGGWSASEVALAVAARAELVRLGPRTLRAEATPTVLLSALWTAWGW